MSTPRSPRLFPLDIGAVTPAKASFIGKAPIVARSGWITLRAVDPYIFDFVDDKPIAHRAKRVYVVRAYAGTWDPNGQYGFPLEVLDAQHLHRVHPLSDLIAGYHATTRLVAGPAAPTRMRNIFRFVFDLEPARDSRWRTRTRAFGPIGEKRILEAFYGGAES